MVQPNPYSGQACHSFTPNSTFASLYHPRFGKIMSIVAMRDLRAGEEVLVSPPHTTPASCLRCATTTP